MQVCVRLSNWKPGSALRLPFRILLANPNFPSVHHTFVLLATSEEAFWNFVLWLSYGLITYESTIRVLVILLVGRVTLFPRNRVLRNWGLLVSEECEPRSLVPLFFTTSLNLAVINSGPFQMEKDESYTLSSFWIASAEAFCPTVGPRGSRHSVHLYYRTCHLSHDGHSARHMNYVACYIIHTSAASNSPRPQL